MPSEDETLDLIGKAAHAVEDAQAAFDKAMGELRGSGDHYARPMDAVQQEMDQARERLARARDELVRLQVGPKTWR